MYIWWRNAYKESSAAHDQNMVSWIGCVKTILNFLDLDIFALSKAKVKQSIINKLKSVFNKVWIKQVFNDQGKRQNARNKLKTYRPFKANIKQEKYTQILDQKQRQILCKFRISSHDLEIEKGRYYQMEPEIESVNYVMLK